MTEHKHADLIKAKVDNMALVVFYKDCYYPEQGWQETSQLPMQEEFDYFLCLPQHKDACLRWLNGDDVQMQSDDEWLDIKDPSIFMSEYTNIRTKSQKQKLWIAVKTDKHEHLGGCRKLRICSHAFVNKQDAEDYLDLSDAQLVEIEIN